MFILSCRDKFLHLNWVSFYFLQHEHPYISAMVNNGTLHYDHDRDGTHTEIAGCEAKFRNKDYDTYVAIRYQDETLKVCYISQLIVQQLNVHSKLKC